MGCEPLGATSAASRSHSRQSREPQDLTRPRVADIELEQQAIMTATAKNFSHGAGPSATVTVVTPPFRVVEQDQILCLDEQLRALRAAYDALVREATSIQGIVEADSVPGLAVEIYLLRRTSIRCLSILAFRLPMSRLYITE
ncbi:hypothetical protein BWQ96_07842 [Gracilariopsis chorda]|uniref:Uncharacterized protein n=1 Tax=Gracilariopsis chorda TaxID=448386 RepID=A0A2V3IK37_9FLOR|nr:hypothetical protein BWQ96_07842 [Gracilariopsis chorda]|eukprot:PXF42431.1 hypothetical protein BWQ96_07842 [Gracilariopsis chorda]